MKSQTGLINTANTGTKNLIHWKLISQKFKKRKNSKMENYNTFKHEDNTLTHTRLLDAPRELVWEVFTNPEHIKEWWGPNGFSLTTKSMTVAPGNTWEFIMHGM